MPRCPAETPSFHLLSDSQILACETTAAAELAARNDVVLMRHGVLRKHIARHSVTADADQTVFFS